MSLSSGEARDALCDIITAIIQDPGPRDQEHDARQIREGARVWSEAVAAEDAALYAGWGVIEEPDGAAVASRSSA